MNIGNMLGIQIGSCQNYDLFGIMFEPLWFKEAGEFLHKNVKSNNRFVKNVHIPNVKK